MVANRPDLILWWWTGMEYLRVGDVSGLKNVKLCFICGSKGRALRITERVAQELQPGCVPVKLATSEGDDWFEFFQIGEICVSSHGMGNGSVDAWMESVLPLFLEAGVKPIIFRLGSSGGIGVRGGVQVVCTGCVNDYGEKKYVFSLNGETMEFDSSIDPSLPSKILEANENSGIPMVEGMTLAGSSYYEAQARLDGSVCNFSSKKKQNCLKTLYEMGVRNMEMEGVPLSGTCNHLGFPFCMVATSYLDRYGSDSSAESSGPEDFKRWAEEMITTGFNFARKFVLNDILVKGIQI